MVSFNGKRAFIVGAMHITALFLVSLMSQFSGARLVGPWLVLMAIGLIPIISAVWRDRGYEIHLEGIIVTTVFAVIGSLVLDRLPI